MIKIALAAASLAVIAAPAVAKKGSWRIGNDQIHIVNSDIDTTTAAGRAIMLARVERAAAKLCRDEIVRVIRRDCIRLTLADTAAAPRNTALRLALTENKGVSLAAR